MNKLEKLKREFLEHVEIEKGNSLKTVRNYDYYLSRFFEFAKITEPKEINDDKIREFRLFLNRQPGLKTKGQQSSSLKKNTQNYHKNIKSCIHKLNSNTNPPPKVLK